MDAKVTEEVSYTTIETSKTSTTNNKKILRNTWTGNAVQVNCYDSEGRLQSVETDKHSWLDTDTEAYKWTDKDTPPNIPPADKNLQIESFIVEGPRTLTKLTDNGSVLMLKSTETSSTPVVHWTGTNTQHVTTSAPNDKGEVTAYPYPLPPTGAGASQIAADQSVVVSNTVVSGTPMVTTEVKLSENSEGQKWSRSEETVWMTSNKRINPDILAITYDGVGEAPSTAKQIEGAAVNGHESLSVEERRKLRRNVSREKTAAAGGGVAPPQQDGSRVRTRPIIERDY